MSVKETSVEQALVRGINARGGRCDKIQFVGKRGCPDRLVALAGRIWLVELKRPKGGRLSAHQSDFARECAKLGVGVVLISSFAEVEGFLAHLDRVREAYPLRAGDRPAGEGEASGVE